MKSVDAHADDHRPVDQGPAYITNLYHQVPEAFVYGNTFLFLAYATVILIAGTMFIMWLGREDHRQKGIGNGISLDYHDRYRGPSAARVARRDQRPLPDLRR